MAIALITKCSNAANGNTTTATTGADIPVGSSIAVFMGTQGAAGNITISDGTANTYIYTGNIGSSPQQTAAYIVSTTVDIPNGTTITAKSTAATNGIGFALAAFSGTSSLDVNATASGASGTVTQSSGALASPTEAMFGGALISGTGAWGDSSGWLNVGNHTAAGGGITVGADYLFPVSNASQTFAPTVVGSGAWSTAIISFAASGLVKFFSLMGVG